MSRSSPKNGGKPAGEEPLLVLTGQTRETGGEMEVMIRLKGKDVWLPVPEFQALVALITATAEEKTATVRPEVIRSIKRRMDEATGVPGTGDSLIAGPE